jgi:hypothetical protein
MNLLTRILHALFWLPILLGGFIGFGFIEPNYHRFGIISLGILGVFMILVFLQAMASRKALLKTRALQRTADENSDVSV